MIPNTSTLFLIDSLGSTHEVNFITDPQDSSGPVAILEAGTEYQLTQDEFKNNTVVIDGGAGYGEFSIDKIGTKNGKLLVKKLIRHLLKVKSIQVKV